MKRKYGKGSKFVVGYDSHWVAKPFIISFPKITLYMKGCYGNKYLIIINNKKSNFLLLKYDQMWKEIKDSKEKIIVYIILTIFTCICKLTLNLLMKKYL